MDASSERQCAVTPLFSLGFLHSAFFDIFLLTNRFFLLRLQICLYKRSKKFTKFPLVYTAIVYTRV